MDHSHKGWTTEWGPVTSKLLHLKRPAFFPILDAVVRAAYDPTARGFSYERFVRSVVTP